MRDEMDGRLWVEHHEAFSEALDGLVARLARAFRNLVAARPPRTAWREVHPPQA